MNQRILRRILLNGLTIAVSIGMLVAAFAYRAEIPPSRVASPALVDSRDSNFKLEISNEKTSAQLQQDRLARLQSRL